MREADSSVGEVNEPEIPPGWYPDPDGKPSDRYWDGGQWGEQTRPQLKTKTAGTPSPVDRAVQQASSPHSSRVPGAGYGAPASARRAPRAPHVRVQDLPRKWFAVAGAVVAVLAGALVFSFISMSGQQGQDSETLGQPEKTSELKSPSYEPVPIPLSAEATKACRSVLTVSAAFAALISYEGADLENWDDSLSLIETTSRHYAKMEVQLGSQRLRRSLNELGAATAGLRISLQTKSAERYLQANADAFGEAFQNVLAACGGDLPPEARLS